jgi:hypothetical protein
VSIRGGSVYYVGTNWVPSIRASPPAALIATLIGLLGCRVQNELISPTPIKNRWVLEPNTIATTLAPTPNGRGRRGGVGAYCHVGSGKVAPLGNDSGRRQQCLLPTPVTQARTPIPRMHRRPRDGTTLHAGVKATPDRSPAATCI